MRRCLDSHLQPRSLTNFRRTLLSLIITIGSIEAYNQGPHTNVECSPLFAESLIGFPPAYVQIAEGDPLRDEGLLYAQRLEAEGVSVKTHM